MAVLYVVVPCYNEEEVICETAKRLSDKLDRMAAEGLCDEKSRILFVDDGSADKTWELLQELYTQYSNVCGLKLAHNKGHQNALMAGLMTARENADVSISVDADLQDDIEVLDQFMQHYHNGCDVVYGVRKRRDTDTFFKRATAQGFYKLMKVLGVDVVYNHADYRLLSNRALQGLEQYKEVNLFLRGIVPTIGYKSECVYYDRAERFAGESKYPLKKMLSFAVDGITSFSVRPLKIISNLGLIISFLSIAGFLYALFSKIFGYTTPGWTAIVCSIWLIGGIQLLCIGIIGTYIGKIYSESKARPKYIVETLLKK